MKYILIKAMKQNDAKVNNTAYKHTFNKPDIIALKVSILYNI